MAEPNPAQELRRLTDLYAGMEDTQLINLAEQGGSLTEQARQALRNELQQRGLDVQLATRVSPDSLEFRKLVSVAHFLTPSEAQVARGVLEAAGIESFLRSENTVRIAWSNLVGGVALQVAEEDADEATKLLATTGGPFESPVDDPES